MNLFALSGLLIGVSSLLFGILIYWKNRQGKVNQLWSIFCFSVAIWGFGGYKIGLTTSLSEAFFWWRLTHIGLIFIPVLFYHFICVFLEIKKRVLLSLAYLFGFFFLILECTPWVDLFFGLSNMKFLYSSFYWIRPPTPLYSFFVFSWFAIIIYSHYVLYRVLRKSSGLKRDQIKYFFLATAVGFAGGGLCYLQVFGINLYPILNFTVPLYPAIMVYAIIRYRLMDIRFVLGRGAVYGLSLITITSFAFSLMWGANRFLPDISPNITSISILIISILFFQYIFRFFEKFASKYFYYTFYSSQRVLTDLGKGLTRVLDLDTLSSLIVNTLINTMKLDRTVVLLREQDGGGYRIQKNIGFKEENGIALVKDSFLTDWLEKNQKPLVSEEIALVIRDTSDKKEKVSLERLQENMKKIEAALCLPLLIEEKIIGMIVLGNKVSRDPYSSQDVDLLTNLTNQASIAFQNAKLYSETKGFSRKMEREVNERTKELKEAYEELKKLDKAKSEFLSIASHQLRTPLAAIKGYISMMLEKSYGEPSKKMTKPLEHIYTSNERLIKLINDLLNISRIEAGRIKIKFEELSLEEIVASIIEELKSLTKEKKIYLKFEKPKKPLPKVLADRDKIRQVILNIIDNAIRYTHDGGVSIKFKAQGSKLKIIISDTGEGMTKEEISNLFESFSRGTAGTRFWTEGAGLGLYIAKKFLDLHHGKISAESKGKGKGSTFFIELPTT